VRRVRELHVGRELVAAIPRLTVATDPPVLMVQAVTEHSLCTHHLRRSQTLMMELSIRPRVPLARSIR